MNPPVFPSFADYQTALQHPEISFSSNFLRLGMVESDLWGFPRVRSGGFALTYKVELKDNTWATRCFHRNVRDRAIRYAQICQTIEQLSLPFFVSTRYFQHGIAVQGKQFPISIIEWIEGESLENYVYHHLDKPDELRAVSEKFRAVCQMLEFNGLSHGDLSHRNIMIKSGEIYLIDYDGMYVPALNGRKNSELGNIHFQHPLRSNLDFNEKLDRFSAIVIYLALIALAIDPGLWQRFQSGGEGLLFQRSDFLDPVNSRLLRALENLPEISRHIPRFRQICLSTMETIPSLDELLTGRLVQPVTLPVVVPSIPKKKTSIPVYHSDWLPSILQSIGQIVSVTGVVKEVFHGHTEEGADHVFLNFGNWKDNCFTAVIWGGVLDDINRNRVDPDSWVGKNLVVTGLMSIRNKRPQIQLEAVTDLVVQPVNKPGITPGISFGNPSDTRKTQPVIQDSSAAEQILVPSTVLPPPARINLDELFNTGKTASMDTVLNQLYSTDHFKKPKSRRKQP